MVTFGQGNVFFYTLLDVLHHTTYVPAAGIGTDHDLAPGVLPVDGVGTYGGRYLCHVGQRHLASVLSVYDKAAYAVNGTSAC